MTTLCRATAIALLPNTLHARHAAFEAGQSIKSPTERIADRTSHHLQLRLPSRSRVVAIAITTVSSFYTVHVYLKMSAIFVLEEVGQKASVNPRAQPVGKSS